MSSGWECRQAAGLGRALTNLRAPAEFSREARDHRASRWRHLLDERLASRSGCGRQDADWSGDKKPSNPNHHRQVPQEIERLACAAAGRGAPPCGGAPEADPEGMVACDQSPEGFAHMPCWLVRTDRARLLLPEGDGC